MRLFDTMPEQMIQSPIVARGLRACLFETATKKTAKTTTKTITKTTGKTGW